MKTSSTKQTINSLINLYEDTKFFVKENQKALLTTGAILLVLTNLVIVQGVLNAVHAIPLLPSLMELIGVGYSVWFSVKYLYSTTGRAELLSELEQIKSEVFGTTKTVAQVESAEVEDYSGLKEQYPGQSESITTIVGHRTSTVTVPPTFTTPVVPDEQLESWEETANHVN